MHKTRICPPAGGAAHPPSKTIGFWDPRNCREPLPALPLRGFTSAQPPETHALLQQTWGGTPVGAVVGLCRVVHTPHHSIVQREWLRRPAFARRRALSSSASMSAHLRSLPKQGLNSRHGCRCWLSSWMESMNSLKNFHNHVESLKNA